ncbi:MAG TPA: superoxide dismutase, Ni [Dehalococcoidia bacterium]|nr:superoxide dismutase, Ni [Dehalococcoidia bacterium]
MLYNAITKLFAAEEAHAHCDIPCGIYDPHLAQIGALSVIRMNQLIDQLQAGDDKTLAHAMARYTATKEEHAELVKREVRIIMGDYFKPEHVEKYPELMNLAFNIMKVASKARQEVNLQAAEELLGQVQRFAEIFWDSKGVATKRQPSNQTVGGEIVVPA